MDISLEIPSLIVALIICIGVPYISMVIDKKNRLPNWLNPIILCYGIGLLSSLFLYKESNKAVLEIVMYLSILLAISLHFFNTKLNKPSDYGKELVVAFFICLMLVGIFSTLICLNYPSDIAEPHVLSGMLAGLYSGSSLNLSAVGTSLRASNELITSALYADILSGTILILFLISIGPYFYGLFLKKGKSIEQESVNKFIQKYRFLENPYSNLKGILIGFAVLLISVVPFMIDSLSQSNKTLLTFLLLSILSVLIGQSKLIKESYQTGVSGDFFLLIFCTCTSLNADLREILVLSKALLPIFFLLILSIMLSHIFICRLLGIELKKAMVAFVAAMYGVPFISQITNTLKAPYLLSGGIGLSVLGMAVGNIFGISVALICKYLGGLM